MPEKPTSPSPYMTIQQVADRWRVSTAAVRRLIADGSLRAFRISTKIIRLRISDVEAYEQGTMTIDDSGHPL